MSTVRLVTNTGGVSSAEETSDCDLVINALPDPRQPWSRITSYLLLAVGAILAVFFFLQVMSTSPVDWHLARESELQATYESYLKTGVLLVKGAYLGSNYTVVPGEKGYVAAAWDDDPGVYMLASLLGKLRHDKDALTAVTMIQALLVAIPMFWMPTLVARVFRRARAGVGLILLPPLLWILQGRDTLPGTTYNMVDTYSGLRVYGLYGISASFVFLSLSLIALASTYRQTRTSMIALTVFFGAMAGAANLNRALSGVTIVGAIVVLWIFHTSSWRKLYIPVAAGICALLVAFSFQLGVMGFVNQHRAAVIGTSMSNLPEGHGTWHPLYLGLSYIGANKDTPSPFGVMWDDKFAWEKAKTVDPNVIPASSEYDQIIKSLYLQEVKNHPVWALTMYTQKAVDTLHQVIWPLLFIALVTILLFRRAKKSGKQLVRIIALALPAILYGLVPPILVYPMRYYESELTAALSLLICVSLGGLVLMLTTKRPVGVKSETVESLADLAAEPDCDISVVVPSRNGSCSLPKTLETLRTSLSSCDEIVVVENGSTDETWQVLRELQSSWPEGGVRLILAQSPPGLGNALREGVLTSHGARCLLTADDLPFGMSDLDEFRKCNSPPNVVIGSKGHPNSRVERSSRRTSMSSVFRQLRRTFLNSTVSDSQGTFWVDGSWAREFAATSREPGLLWTTELVLASESQGLEVGEVPVTLVAEHEQVASRFGLSDAVSSVYRTLKLSGYKDYYQSFHVPVKVYSEIG